jgi:hypothetical protein
MLREAAPEPGAVRAAGEAGEAEGYYRRALALADELGMRPLAAHCHASLSKLYSRSHDPVRAQEHCDTATRMYREMEMCFWGADRGSGTRNTDGMSFCGKRGARLAGRCAALRSHPAVMPV